MTEFRMRWRTAKTAFLQCGEPTADFPADFVLLMASNQGFNLGPALDEFDRGRDMAERFPALAKLTVAQDG